MSTWTDKAQVVRRKREHRCVLCGEKLPDGHKFFNCDPCRMSERERIAAIQGKKGTSSRLSYHRWTEAEKVRLLRLLDEGKTVHEAAEELGTTFLAVRQQLRRMDYEDSAEGLQVERCRCGLALPCNSCLPSIYHYAAGRRGSSTGL